MRGQFEWDATDALNLRLTAGTVQEDDKKETSDITYDPAGPFANVVLPAWRAAGISDTCTDNDPHNRITCVNQPLTTDLDAKEATLLATYTLPNDWTINSISSWDHFLFKGTMNDVAQMQAPLLQFQDRQESDSLQQELRLTSAGGQKVDWLGGVFYYTNEFQRGDDTTRLFIGDTFSSHPVVAAVNQQLLRPDSGIAVPAARRGARPGRLPRLEARYRVSRRVRPGDLEYERTASTSPAARAGRKKARKRTSVSGSTIRRPASSRCCCRRRRSARPGSSTMPDDVTWSVTPQWRITDNAMLFATASHGFKSGGFNTGFGQLPIAQREFERRGHHALRGRREVRSERPTAPRAQRVPDHLRQLPGRGLRRRSVHGRQRRAGDGSKVPRWKVTLLIGDRLTADFAVSYADLIYTKNTHGQCYPGRAPNSTTTPGACDLSGEHPVNAPEWKTHLGLQYDQPVGWGDLFARADWSWTSEYNTSFSADPRLKQEAYDWVNLRAGTRWNNYELVFWADNVTNETVVNLDPVLTLYAG